MDIEELLISRMGNKSQYQNLTAIQRFRLHMQRMREHAEDLIQKMKERDGARYIFKAPAEELTTRIAIEPIDFVDDEFDTDWTDDEIFIRIPWWAIIAIVTISIKWLLLPLQIISRKIPLNTWNETPSTTLTRVIWLCVKIILLIYKLVLFPFIQTVVFATGLVTLIVLSQIPVKTMKESGLGWYKDLTVPDRYYVLPLLISASVGIEIMLGMRNVETETVGLMKYILRTKPLFILPITIKCPAAAQLYWLLWSLMTLIQMPFLRPPRVMICPKAPRTYPATPSAPEIENEEDNTFV